MRARGEKDSGCARVGGNDGTRGMRHATSSAYHARLHPGALCAPAAAHCLPPPFSLMHIVLNAWQVISRLTRDRQRGWAGPYFNILGPPASSYWRAPTRSRPTKTTASSCKRCPKAPQPLQQPIPKYELVFRQNLMVGAFN